jgi:hypothetical protein
MKQTCSLMLTATAAVLLTASVAFAQTQPVISVNVVGTTVNIAWTPVPGATSYRADLGTYFGGANLASVNVGTRLGGTVSLQNNATYFVRITPLGAGTPADAGFNVGTPRPGVPENFTASVSGGTLTFTWAPPASGGAPAAYVLQVGSQFNSTNLAPGINVGNTLTFSVPNVGGLLPPGSYFTRLVAVNGGGVSDPSDEAVFTFGDNTLGVPTPVSAVVNGSSATLSWNAPNGGAPVTAYGIEGAYGHYANLPPRATVPATTTSLTVDGLVNGSYYWRVRAYNGGTAGGVFGTASFFVGPRPAMWVGPRTADPRVGRALPRPPYGQSVVQSMASVYRGDLNNSCREFGGNNLWMFKVVRELRRIDTRWGLNWKRGNVGDLSQDVVAYNWGTNPDEGTVDAYIWDIIGGHCGPRPDWFWRDVTSITLESRTTMRWTLRPYLAAGLQP